MRRSQTRVSRLGPGRAHRRRCALALAVLRRFCRAVAAPIAGAGAESASAGRCCDPVPAAPRAIVVEPPASRSADRQGEEPSSAEGAQAAPSRSPAAPSRRSASSKAADAQDGPGGRRLHGRRPRRRPERPPLPRTPASRSSTAATARRVSCATISTTGRTRSSR